jgi:hypothetical protein
MKKADKAPGEELETLSAMPDEEIDTVTIYLHDNILYVRVR